jgi:hypothetical protein
MTLKPFFSFKRQQQCFEQKRLKQVLFCTMKGALLKGGTGQTLLNYPPNLQHDNPSKDIWSTDSSSMKDVCVGKG